MITVIFFIAVFAITLLCGKIGDICEKNEKNAIIDSISAHYNKKFGGKTYDEIDRMTK